MPWIKLQLQLVSFTACTTDIWPSPGISRGAVTHMMHLLLHLPPTTRPRPLQGGPSGQVCLPAAELACKSDIFCLLQNASSPAGYSVSYSYVRACWSQARPRLFVTSSVLQVGSESPPLAGCVLDSIMWCVERTCNAVWRWRRSAGSACGDVRNKVQ
jgi:hypothetical protein